MQKRKLILKYSETEEYDISEVLRWLNTFNEVIIRV